MRKEFRDSDSMSNKSRYDRFREIALSKLSERTPLMIKDLARICEVSPNTAGKYVDIMEAKELIRINPYATAKQIFLINGDKARKK